MSRPLTTRHAKRIHYQTRKQARRIRWGKGAAL